MAKTTKVQVSKEEKKIKSDVEEESFKFDELRIQRNMEDLTPEVIEMCKAQVDRVLEIAKKNLARKDEDLELAASQIKNDQDLLVAVSQFLDVYEEVLAENKLIRAKKLDRSTIVRHRELDIALYHGKVCKMQHEKKYSPAIHGLIYEYGRRNDKR